MADPIRDSPRPAVPPRTEACRRPSRHSHLPTGSTTHFWHISPCRADSCSLPWTGCAGAKTSHADSGALLRETGATSNSWGVLFSAPPPKKPCSSPSSKRYTDACQPDLQHSSPWNYFPNSHIHALLLSCKLSPHRETSAPRRCGSLRCCIYCMLLRRTRIL